MAFAVCALTASAQQSDSTPDQDSQQYEGPSVLTRDPSSIGERGGRLIDFRYYVDVSGVYDSGLIAPQQSNSSAYNSTGAIGGQVAFGVLGSRTWKKSRFSLEYRGDYNRFTNQFSGANQFLNIAYARTLSKRLFLDIRENLGSTNQTNGYYNSLPLTTTDLIGVPVNDLFNQRTSFLDTRADVTWEPTLRTSYSAGMAGYIVRRADYYIPGGNGFDVHTAASRRITRRQTVSVQYQHQWFNFQRTYGHSTEDFISLSYSATLNPRWQVSGSFGAGRVHVLGLQTIQLDPSIAAIVGVSSATIVLNKISYIPTFQARLTRKFTKAGASLDFNEGVTPGNGVFLTSRQKTFTANYSYLGFTKLSMQAGVGYSQLSSIGQVGLGNYTNYTAGGGFTYKFARDMHTVFRYDFRKYNTQIMGLQNDSNRVSLGIAYSPGDRPLAIW